MMEMSLKEISRACGGRLFSDNGDILITNITTNSSVATRGSLFAAMVGKRTDGHGFIEDAMKLGAAAVLCEKPPANTNMPYILTSSTLTALQNIAAYMLREADIPVIGISGSVGKTSTKEAVASVLSQKYSVLKTNKNYNNELGLPLTIFELKKENDVAVLEMGISGFGEMHLLASIARPNICVLTNVGDCHLEFLKDRAGVFKAKSEIFDFIEPHGHIILNGDDEYLSSVKNIKGIRPVFFGFGKANDVWADNIKSVGIRGVCCDIHSKEGKFTAWIPKPGKHMVYNALAAAAVGIIMGVPAEKIKKGLESIESVSGRFNIIEENGITIIDDCYNANPMSMCSSLDILSHAASRKVAVLGDMGELGKKEKEFHVQIGKFAAGLNIDLIICIGKLSRNICFEVRKNPKIRAISYDNTDEFIKDIELLIKKDDTVLVKASHFMEFEKIVEDLKKL